MFHVLGIDFSLLCTMLCKSSINKLEQKCVLSTTYPSFIQNFFFRTLLGDLKIFDYTGRANLDTNELKLFRVKSTEQFDRTFLTKFSLMPYSPFFLFKINCLHPI